MSTRLAITQTELTTDGLLIKQMEVIDGVSGEVIKIANLTPELAEFFEMLEIEVDDYFKIKAMKEKHPEFRKLVNEFKLCK